MQRHQKTKRAKQAPAKNGTLIRVPAALPLIIEPVNLMTIVTLVITAHAAVSELERLGEGGKVSESTTAALENLDNALMPFYGGKIKIQ